MSFDAPVHLSKSSFMQRVLDYSKVGYWHFTTGEVHISKAKTLVRKFTDLYLIDLKKDSRYRRKQNKLGNAQLLLFKSSAEVLYFILMVTDGDHPAHTMEKLKDIRRKEFPVFTGYTLCVRTAKGLSKPTTSWRMTDDLYSRWRNFVVSTVRHRNANNILRAWHSIHKTPGFSGIRADAKKIASLVRSEIKRRYPDGKALILPHKWHFYLSRISSDTASLSSIIRGYNAQAN